MPCHAIALALVLGQPPATGPQTATATLSVNVAALARMALSTVSLVFPDADPDAAPIVPSTPEAVVITAKVRAPRDAQVMLTVRAADDLRSGVTTLPASLISWTAQGDGFTSGLMSRTSDGLVAMWTGSGERSGAQRFGFENRWTHPPGTYSITFVYTMSTP